MVVMQPVYFHAPKLTAKTEPPKFILHYPTTRFNTSTPTSPTTETIVSITDQDRIVSLMDKLKYSLNIQKPPSLTCEKKRLPAPTDKTIRLGSTCIRTIRGKI